MPISVGDSLSDDHFITGSLHLSGGFHIASLQSSYDLAGGFPFMITQNTRKGQVKVTTNGTLANGAFVYVVVASNQVAHTDAFALSIASSSIAAEWDQSVQSGITPRAEVVQDGYFVLALVNHTGGTIANDSIIHLNWAAI
tara:strand:- start:248 stop:670 length:423 start_codon:yes stop_codon:yes gene_type:complete